MEPTAKILLIDDDSVLLSAMSRMLEKSGYTVIEASTGADGIRLAKAHHPDIAIVDIVLPDMDGMTVHQSIQSDKSLEGTSVILISSLRTSAEDQADGLEAGVAEYIARPMHNREFVARVTAVIRDKHAKDFLQKTCINLEEELLAIFAGAPICIFLTDGEARLIKANQTIGQYFGQEAEDMTGHPCGAAFHCVHTADDPAGCGFGPFCTVCGLRKTVEDTYTTEKPHLQKEAKLTYRKEEKTYERVVRVSTSVLRMSGEKRVLVCMEDITEQKETERENCFLADAIRFSSQAFAVGYPDGRIGLVNPAFCDLVGYTEEELRQIDWNRVLTSEAWREQDARYLAELTVTGKPVHYEKAYIHKDGHCIPIEMLVHIKTDESGKTLYYYAFIRDLTERRQADERRQMLENQLHQAQKLESVGRLAGGVAHDFNNLLSIIMGYGEIALAALGKDHPQHAMLEQIYQAGTRAKQLTRQLLAFSRKQILEMQVVDVNVVITGFEKLLRRLIGEDIQLTLATDFKPLMVNADTAQIEQVLMNLAVNARDAMPDGGKLSIDTRVAELDETYARSRPGVIPGDYALISVSDTGSGMDKDTLEHIFEPFFTTKDKDKGTGLGLATSFGIIKQHGGNIWVYSEPGHGTTFKIYLPLCTENAEAEARPVNFLHTATVSATVLIVEDDPIVRKLAGVVLADHGYVVIESDDVSDAILKAAAHENPIHLVLTDVVMPEMKGPEVFDKIREHHPEARVLYMSGYTDSMIARHGVLNQGIQFIQKPFTVNGLIEKCHQALHGK
jgi:PAS domain S-box-containing protein